MGLMESMAQIREKSPVLANRIQNQGYCLYPSDLKTLESLLPNLKLLVRCGKGRFWVQAQDCQHFTNMIKEHAASRQNNHMTTDYVRDVSIPS